MQPRLLALAYDATLQPEGWAPFLHGFRLATRSGGALLMFGDATGSDPRRDLRDADWQTLTLARLYYDTWRAHNPLDYRRMEPGRVYGYEDFLPRADFECSAYFREYCARTATAHAMVGCFGDSAGTRAWLNVSRGAEGGAYTAAERRLLQALLPHLSRVLAICARLERADADQRRLHAQVDALGIATLLLDRDARVVVANRVATSLLAGHEALQLADERLCFGVPRERRAFEDAMAALLAEPGSDSASFMVAPQAPRAIGVLMRRLPEGEGPAGARVALYLRPRTGAAPFLRTEHVASLFGLTANEARLAVLLAEGQSLRQIAAAMGIAEASARTYCKRVFDKTGTARQAELVRLVLNCVAGF